MASLSARSDLQESIDEPVESLSQEYKATLDLTKSLGRAKLARHLAALANHGGGIIVLGFSDDLKPITFTPTSHDEIASIAKSYLEPTIHCDVFDMVSRDGGRHQIIMVPSHGPTPVCARADGPQDEKGRVQGISAGSFYIRKPGPESAPMKASSDWTALIRRCVMSERASLLGAIEVALQSRPQADRGAAILQTWHNDARASYETTATKLAIDRGLGQRFLQLSYMIRPHSSGPSLDEMIRVLESTNSRVDASVYSGWGMMHIFHGKNAPRFKTSPSYGSGELEFLECDFLTIGSNVGATDLWRVSPDGLTTLIRGYWEDSGHWVSSGAPLGKTFSPNQLVMSMAEFSLHASVLAESYPDSAAVLFRCEWTGLQGRHLHDFQGRWLGVGHPAHDDRRVSTLEVSIGDLKANWACTVSKLCAPIARVFGIAGVLTEDWIAGQIPKWRRDALR